MAKVELLTNAEVNKIVKVGSHRAIDMATRREFNVCFGGARNDHYDVTPTTEADVMIMEQIIGRSSLDTWRPSRPTVVVMGDRMVSFGLCYFMHHIRIGGGNPGPRYISRNEAGPPWSTDPRGGHVCCYASNSVGGGGDAPNAACSAEANAHARQIHNGGQGGQARAACYEAYILGNRIFGNIATPLPPAPPTPTNTHTVASGETMSGIAREYGFTLSELARANPQIANIDVIYVGQRINIPAEFREYDVSVTASTLNVRTGPGTNNPFAAWGTIKNGTALTVMEESDGAGANRWGKVKNSQGLAIGWVALDYTQRT